MMKKRISLFGLVVWMMLSSVAHAQDVDSDNDGMPDTWETAYSLNASDPADASTDADGDGFNNFGEYWMGTDPQNAADPVRLYVDANYTGAQEFGTASQPFKRMQSAINAASSSEVTAIMVLPGTYNERLFANGKAHIHFFSQAGAEATIIDGQQVDSSVVRMYNFSRATFRGFTVRNAATDWLGAGLRIEATNGVILVAENIITSNKTTNTSSSGGAGGIYIKTANGSRLVNNFIVKNSARRGGGVLFAGGNVEFWHNTVADNEATDGLGGGISTLLGVRPDIRNNIIWGNTGGEGIAQVHAAGSLAITNNIVQGGWNGAGNIDADPQFISPFLNDYHIRAESPARNAAALLPLMWDFDAEPRPEGVAKDVGADEFVDTDDDGLPDSWELRYGLNPHDGLDADYDYDGDGVRNYQEYFQGTDPTDWDTDKDGFSDATFVAKTATTSSSCPPPQDYSIPTDPNEVTLLRISDRGPVNDGYIVTGPVTLVWASPDMRKRIFRIEPQPGPVTVTVTPTCDPNTTCCKGPEITIKSGVLNLGCHLGYVVPDDKDENPGCAMLAADTNRVAMAFSPGLPKGFDQSVTVSWSPPQKLQMWKANGQSFPNGHTFTGVNSPTVLYMQALEPGEVEITATSYGVVEKVKLTIHAIQLLDAQGFDPQWSPGNPPELAQPLYANVDTNLFGRLGALTDGTSLLVVRSHSTNQILGPVTLRVEDKGGGGGIQTSPQALGSFHAGDHQNLPPLPATATNAGNTTLTTNEASLAVFYRPGHAWYFPHNEKERPLEITVTHGGQTARLAFKLVKPPLVLVHGLFGSATSWDGFGPQLAAANISVNALSADYAPLNTAGFDAIFAAVPEAIRVAVTSNRTAKVAAARVDVVAHSMGTDATRWYMTPSSSLPHGADRGWNPVEPLLFKTPPIVAVPRPPEDEFRRPDNFGLGDIRRFITFGGVHTGTSLAFRGIRIVNAGIRAELERRKDHLKVVTFVERLFRFEAIRLDEPGTPDIVGMALVDLAAFGLHPLSGWPPPPKSVALNALLDPMPVKYAAVEGTWNLTFLGSPFRSLLRSLGNVLLGFPSDVQPHNSDGVVPAASARNLGPRVPELHMDNTSHSELIRSPGLGTVMEKLLGADESLFR